MQDPGKGGAQYAGVQRRRLAQLAGQGSATRIITSAAERAGSWLPCAPSPRGVSTLSLHTGEATGLCGEGRARASPSFHLFSF